MNSLGKWERPILILSDVILINLAYMLAFYFRYNYRDFTFYFNSYKSIALLVTVIYIVCFFLFRLYGSLWSFASIDEFMLVIGSCLTANMVTIIATRLVGHRFAYGASVIACAFSIIFIVGFRMSYRVYGRFESILNWNASKSDKKRVLIIGAGAAAAMVIKEMKSSDQSKYRPVAVIDDEDLKKGNSIMGVKILGNRKDILSIVKDKDVETILLAIPTIEDDDKKEILEICKKTDCKIEIIPGMYDIMDGKVSLNQIRKVDIEDLLGRKAVVLDMKGIASYITGKVILVTGGGGSIGSELCRQIAKFDPKQLIVLDIYENNAYDLQIELQYKYPKLDLKVLIGSVKDVPRLEGIFEKYSPNIIFHAAAHKHVPLMEVSPLEAIKNNVFGTYNVACCAHKYKADRFVMISTDKAVNPTNVMGATKRMCEMIVQSMNSISKTQFVAVRFGNVLGSNGSVIPLFNKQIAHGGPVTLTNKYITRFFMTIPEASQLVLQAGAYAQGGEIFVLDMGKPVKIYDLAWDLIKLSGFVPNEDIKIEIIGLRPGEKLYEELLMSEEGLTNTKHEKIFIGKQTFTNLDEVKERLTELAEIIKKDDVDLLYEKIKEIVPTYNRSVADSEVATEEEK